MLLRLVIIPIPFNPAYIKLIRYCFRLLHKERLTLNPTYIKLIQLSMYLSLLVYVTFNPAYVKLILERKITLSKKGNF